MKKFQFKYSVWAVVLAVGMTSCTDYLDKEGDSTITEEVAFKNYYNFQGFIDEIYNCIPNKVNVNYTVSFNWGDDEIMNTGNGEGHFTSKVDNGNFRAWSTDNQNWLYRNGTDSRAIDVKKHALWNHAWYCIRKANLGLANLDRMVGTQEEKNLIAGQLYFFRAWWLEELMQWFGPLPYLDHAIGASETMKLPRPTYQEAAEKCYADFRKAADLLPVEWDDTQVGRQTKGENKLRIHKMAALGYAGKVLLWAASPLMENGAQLGGIASGKTYQYNTALAQRAAEVFGELLSLVESGTTPIALAQFDFENVYNHKATEAAKNNSYSNIFYTMNESWAVAGVKEALLRGSNGDSRGYMDCSLYQFGKTWGPKSDDLIPDDKVVHHPTANYVNYAYGMADGTPAYIIKNGQLVANTAAEGGSFDPTHPWKDRDPRFYHDIVFDGFRYVETDIPDASMKKYQYSCLYTGGNVRDASLASRTGYFTQKLTPHQCNRYDNGLNWGTNYAAYLPYMRLADIYLMYAEAGAAVSGANFKAASYGKTAEEAINVLRDRVGAGHVSAAYTADKNKFMDEVRRERACELAFEGFRFNDLQRWLLLTEKPYTIKTSQEFDRAEPDSYFEEGNDPKDAKVARWREETILERNYGKKHYWFPLLDKDVYLYAEFPQNEGWGN
jgi:hypothetical protein